VGQHGQIGNGFRYAPCEVKTKIENGEGQLEYLRRNRTGNINT
jgi:hypothetical protein